jgi:hypothetical protein
MIAIARTEHAAYVAARRRELRAKRLLAIAALPVAEQIGGRRRYSWLVMYVDSSGRELRRPAGTKLHRCLPPTSPGPCGATAYRIAGSDNRWAWFVEGAVI